ncbi:MAG: VWA domain-containing protein [Pseudomonadota bacterium]
MTPSFAHPWLLLLLPLALWLGWRLRAGAPAAFSRPPLTLRHPVLARLGLDETRVPGASRRWLALVAALLALAAARPQTEGGWLPPDAEGRDILLLIDASPSMAIHDMSIDGKIVPRMALLKQTAAAFIAGREHDRLGMIVFSDSAATAVPLTPDRDVVNAQLARLSPGSTGAATAIGEGLGVALRQLDTRGGPAPVVVLFTDGDNTGGILRPREALAYAEQVGLHLYTVAVTPDAPTPEAAADGLNNAAGSSAGTQGVPRREKSTDGLLREPSLREMSDLTGGAAYHAADADSLSRILADIDRREATHAPPPSERVKIEWYPLPLGLALLLLALGQWFDLRGGRA